MFDHNPYLRKSGRFPALTIILVELKICGRLWPPNLRKVRILPKFAVG